MISTRIFEFKDDKSAKFLEIMQNGISVPVRYGKRGPVAKAWKSHLVTRRRPVNTLPS